MQIEFTTKSRALSLSVSRSIPQLPLSLSALYSLFLAFSLAVRNPNNEPECEREEGTESNKDKWLHYEYALK